MGLGQDDNPAAGAGWRVAQRGADFADVLHLDEGFPTVQQYQVAEGVALNLRADGTRAAWRPFCPAVQQRRPEQAKIETFTCRAALKRLFSYLALLNSGVALIARYKAWRSLKLYSSIAVI